MKQFVLRIASIATFFCSFSFFPLFALPQGYGGLMLGMNTEDAKDALMKNTDFGYRGEKDVSLLPTQEQALIHANASKQEYSFFTDTYLQFAQDSLYIITLNIKPSFLDYSSLFSSLQKKYGNPSSFSPSGAIWSDDSVVLSLEKPLTLKYTDAKKQKELEENQGTEKSVKEKAVDDFLQSL